VWAVSSDGSNWNIYPGFIIRSAYEATDCGAGFQVLDLLVDGNYAYLLVQSPDSFIHIGPDFCDPDSVVAARTSADQLYLLRTLIDNNLTNTYGFTTWELAANPLTAAGEYTWKPVTLGAQLNFEPTGTGALNGYPIMRNYAYLNGQHINQQAAIAPVFASAAPGAPARYIGISSAGQTQQILFCWSTSSLNKPFTTPTTVVNAIPGGLPAGEYGWYLSYTHYPDNTSSIPRVTGPAFDLWMVGSNGAGNVTNKVTARLGGYIYWP